MYQPTAPIYQSIKEATNSESLYSNCAGKSSKTATLTPVSTKYECPLCFNYLLPPIYQCFNGHTLCNSCESKIKKCPSCREDLPTKKIRSLVLEELVVGLKFNCKNQHLGCPVKNLKFGQINDHASACLFMEIPYCEGLGLNCKEMFTAGHIIAHLESAHSITGVDFGKQSCSDPYVQVFQSLPETKIKRSRKILWTPHYLKLRDNVFFLKSYLDIQEKCCSWMVCIGDTTEKKNVANDFVASIKLMSRVSSVNTLEWRGKIGNLRTQFNYSAFTFSVPLKILETYTSVSDGDANDSLKWVLEVRLLKRDKPQPPVPPPSPLLSGQHGKQTLTINNSASMGTDINVEKKSPKPPIPARPANFQSQSPKPTFVLVTEVMHSPAKLGLVDKIGRDMMTLENMIRGNI